MAWVTPQLREMLAEVIDTAIALTDADFGDIHFLDAAGRLRMIAHRNFPDWWLDYWEASAEREPLCGMALMSGDRAIIEDIELSPTFADTASLGIYLRAGIRASQCTPLFDNSGNKIGTFSTHHQTTYRPDPKALKVMDRLATHASTLIKSVRDAHTLMASKELLHQAINAAEAGIWKVNLATGEMTASERTLELHGVPKGTPISHALALTYHFPEDRENIDRAVRHTAETGEPFRMELRVRMEDESMRWIASYGERRMENGQPCVVGLVQDITEHKRMQLDLEASESRYRSVVQDQTEVISRFLPDGTLVFVNDVFCRVFGQTPDALLGQKWQPIVHPDDLPMIHSKLNEMSTDNPVVTIENRVFVAAGEMRWMQFVNRGIFDTEGSLKKIQSVGRDVTKLKEIEINLRESQERLEMALTGSGIVFWDRDIATDSVVIDQRIEALLGYSPDELSIMDNWWPLVHPEDRKYATDAVATHLQGNSSAFDIEHRFRHKDGHWVTVELRGKVTRRDSHGNPLRMAGTIIDITHRKKLSNEGIDLLKRVEQLIRGLDSQSKMGVDHSEASSPSQTQKTPLSRRNLEILKGIAEGKSTIQMAQELNISIATAKTHRRNLMRKLDLKNRAELIRYAIKQQIIKI